MSTTNTNNVNNFYKIRTGFYNRNNGNETDTDTNNYTRVDNISSTSLVKETDSNNPKYYNVTIADLTDYIPCLSLEYTGNEYDTNGDSTAGINIDEGFKCIFKTETTFADTSDDYNGCIAFAWTNNSLEADAVPVNCHGNKYNRENAEQGLLYSSLQKDGMKGITLTLYPGENFEYEGYTTKMCRYIINCKTSENTTNFMGVLTQSIDVYYDYNSLSVEHIPGKYNFYLNEVLFASIPEESIDIGEDPGYFTTTMITSPYIEANINISDINNNYIHLTGEEKINLNNLGVSVLNYYIDNEKKDYTKAFQEALLYNKRVYVPGGTYVIRGGLEVRDNCELELAQDAVLEFKYPEESASVVNEEGESTNTGTEGTDETGTGNDSGTVTEETTETETVEDIEPWTEEINDAYKCITLKMSSSLVGNHATIRVPYDFDGIVIYASTRSHPTAGSITSVEPFDKWDPQWKPSRYLKDVNIVKPIEQNKEYLYDPVANITKKVDDSLLGRHASLNGEYNGTAVFVEGYRSPENEGSTFIWGLDYSGLRIAGAFEFGVYGTNNWQPALDENGKEYENWAWTYDMRIEGIIDGCMTGVYLKHCCNARISAVIQPRYSYDKTNATKSDTYAENGIYLIDSTNVDLTGSRVWDWNESNTKWTASGENQHIRLDGDCHGLILDDFLYYEMSGYNIRDLIYTLTHENYDNMTILQEPVSKFISIDTDKTKASLLVDRKIDNETNPGEIITAYGMTATDMIYCGRSDGNAIEITVNNIDFNGDNDSLIAFYDANYIYIPDAAILTSRITAPAEAMYFRISCKTDIIGDESSVTVNGNTIYFKKNYLKDGIYVKDEYVEE